MDPNIPVGTNRNGPLHLNSDRNLWENGKHLEVVLFFPSEQKGGNISLPSAKFSSFQSIIRKKKLIKENRIVKAGFHMIAESSAIIWKHTSAIFCDPAIVIADDRRR